ncbi:hypothetical protein [Rossellomorea marisflavi]|uniref:hypothetical protein n=1 Tax=Rossellomorea marisflavi TaxID=189381 RepID=UPI00138F857F|nr:hypothetical protein [Rossellomorea marisflavi]
MARLLREWRAGETQQAQPMRLTARPAESEPPQRNGTVLFQSKKILEHFIDIHPPSH